jgi:hypothetical protein
MSQFLPWGVYTLTQEVEIPDALRHIGDIFHDPFEQAMDDIANGYVALYKGEIVSVGAVLSGRFRDRVHVRSASRYGDTIEKIIASEVPYSGVVEYGWIERARGQASYPGRYPAARAIDRGQLMLREAFDNQLARIGVTASHFS